MENNCYLKVSKNEVEIDGTKNDIMALLCTLIFNLIDDEDGEQILTKEELQRCVNLAKTPRDILKKRTEELKDELNNKDIEECKKKIDELINKLEELKNDK